MTETSTTVSRMQLMYGLCLAVAALIGFFIAAPLRYSSLFVLCSVAGLLAFPWLMKWHRVLLVTSFHSVFMVSFLPGELPLWCYLTAIGFFMVVLNRCLSREVTFVHPGGVAWSLVALVVVVVATAWLQGGVGVRALGSATYGGKKYITLLLGVAAYFVLVARPIPRNRAALYMGLFCLMALTKLLSHLLFMAGSKFYWLFNFISSDEAYSQAVYEAQAYGNHVFRTTAFSDAAGGVIGFMLAMLGMRGVFNLRKPWFLALTILCIGVGMVGGFRSYLIGIIFTFTVLFFMEGLHRTHLLALALAVSLAGGLGLVFFSDKLPISVQRSLTFMPLKLDPWVRQDAQGSLDWRIEMWGYVSKEIPGHLLLGKGYAIDPDALRMTRFNSAMDYGIKAEWAALSGAYHNGPLSVLIPFGIWGALAFGWFLVAGLMRLWWHCKHGHPELLKINRALFVFFLTHAVFFVFLNGSLFSGMVDFAFLIGLAESMNASPSPAESPAEVEEEEAAASEAA